ncbi:hypothetical protein DPMN_166925 [Dreissena polymorpha]|uniref:Uncharacterized protein n=1 Tax=Dreissena polymorpha TaxID=45954 RepID=A0A9D4F3H0_DREPO|nr:hypothetical protein DPMN_166925 [Dreissena polymorpha]
MASHLDGSTFTIGEVTSFLLLLIDNFQQDADDVVPARISESLIYRFVTWM